MPQTFSMQPRGPFDLANQQHFFGSWLDYSPDSTAVAMAFPVEGWAESAAVVLRQSDDGTIRGEVHGADGDGDSVARAWEQTLAVLSLDVDGSDFPRVGERDPVIGRLQREHGYRRRGQQGSGAALYSLDHRPGLAEVIEHAQAWRPFRMWSLVLLHVWIRGEGGGSARS